jgi:type 1 glutamine amidotransferase
MCISSLVLMSTSRFPDANKGNSGAEGPYYQSWIKNYGQGRVFYCAFGHREEHMWNPPLLKHYLAGIQFASGDLQADSSPSQKAALQ